MSEGMNKDELKSILEQHELWIKNTGGKRAGLRWNNLQGADLQGADLRWADLQGANLQGANMQGANLQGANMQSANLQGADLQGANLDYSCLPLWCGSKGVMVDRRIAAQIAAHFCALNCDDADYQAAREAILEFAKTSHRAGDLGLVKEREE